MRRSGARVVAYSGTDSVEVPGMTNSIAATLVAEAGALPINQDPAFATVTFTPYKYGKIVQVSQELASDSRFDIMNQVLIPDTANAFTLTENTAFFTGTGTGQPQGITVGATLGVTCASATLITADEIIDLYYSLPEQYRMNAVWMMNPATEQFIRKLKFTAGTNDYLWSPGFSERPATILGRPVFTAAGMPTIAAAARTICFYDPAAYWVMDFGGGMMMQRLDELYAGNDQVGFKFTKRMDGRVVNADGTRYLRQL
jgi:HK97 family phage major capsid protein